MNACFNGSLCTASILIYSEFWYYIEILFFKPQPVIAIDTFSANWTLVSVVSIDKIEYFSAINNLIIPLMVLVGISVLYVSHCILKYHQRKWRCIVFRSLLQNDIFWTYISRLALMRVRLNLVFCMQYFIFLGLRLQPRICKISTLRRFDI